MICVLPNWVAHGLTLALILIGGGSGYFAFHVLSAIGARRHPRMDFDDAHHRRWWESGGVLLGLVAFVVLASIAGEALRPIACELVGDYQPRPSYRP